MRNSPRTRGANGRTSMRTNEEYKASGFFAIRTPLLPLSVWTEWADGMPSTGSGADDEVGASAEDNLCILRARLREWLTEPIVREALFLASPGLEDRIEQWLRDPPTQKSRKIERSLIKYFARMAGRCTPFGLFAGCSVGRISSSTRLELGPRVS